MYPVSVQPASVYYNITKSRIKKEQHDFRHTAPILSYSDCLEKRYPITLRLQCISSVPPHAASRSSERKRSVPHC